MELAAHFALERLVDDLVLLHPRLAAERLGNDGGGVMVAVAGEIADRHLGVRKPRPDQPLDVVRCHGHGGFTCLASAGPEQNRQSLNLRQTCLNVATTMRRAPASVN